MAAASRVHEAAGAAGGGLGEVAGDAGADATGGVVGAGLGEGGEAGLAGLEAGHGAAVVQAVEDLVVEHDLGLVLGVGDGVPHVLAGPAAGHHLVVVGPLKDVAAHPLGHVTALELQKRFYFILLQHKWPRVREREPVKAA